MPPLLLLVEDDEANVQMLGDYLRAKRYHVIVARNGTEAVALATGHLPDLILMDIEMPDMNGLDAMRQIRAHPSLARIPIIALSGLAMPGDRERGLAAGADEYICKPAGLRQLIDLINQRLPHNP